MYRTRIRWDVCKIMFSLAFALVLNYQVELYNYIYYNNLTKDIRALLSVLLIFDIIYCSLMGEQKC